MVKNKLLRFSDANSHRVSCYSRMPTSYLVRCTLKNLALEGIHLKGIDFLIFFSMKGLTSFMKAAIWPV